MVHRLLKEHWARGARTLSAGETEALEDRLDGVAARSSERERAAMISEREVDSYFAALFLKDKVGEEFDGVVAAVTPFGLFVELKEVHVEGLVKAETLGDGAAFDEERHRLVFAHGPSYGLGAELKVRVANVNLARRHIDLEVLGASGAMRPAREPRREPQREQQHREQHREPQRPVKREGKRKAPRRRRR
jgi:ribonuclease R